MQPLRIMLVDDQILFRKGIASLLSPKRDFVVVGEAGNGLEAAERVSQIAPDVILMDIDMPLCNGIEAVKRIKAEHPDIQIVMLTVSEDDDDLFQAIENGAMGYLLKQLQPQELYEMLEGLREGKAPLSGAVAGKILQKLRRPGGNHAERREDEEVDALTEREIEVLEQVAEGLTNKEIADTLFITENTVKIHLRNILEKLHVANRVQAAVYAVREGLLDEK